MLLKTGVNIAVHHKELYSGFDNPFEMLTKQSDEIHALIPIPIWNGIYQAQVTVDKGRLAPQRIETKSHIPRFLT